MRMSLGVSLRLKAEKSVCDVETMFPNLLLNHSVIRNLWVNPNNRKQLGKIHKSNDKQCQRTRRIYLPMSRGLFPNRRAQTLSRCNRQLQSSLTCPLHEPNSLRNPDLGPQLMIEHPKEVMQPLQQSKTHPSRLLRSIRARSRRLRSHSNSVLSLAPVMILVCTLPSLP